MNDHPMASVIHYDEDKLKEIAEARKQGLFSDKWIIDRLEEMEHANNCPECREARISMNRHMGYGDE